jgi:predicted N-acyltransferase
MPLQFFEFYQTTIDKWWGRPYLKREFFHRIGSDMGDEVLLVIAEEDGETVAAALNLIGRYVTTSCDSPWCAVSYD